MQVTHDGCHPFLPHPPHPNFPPSFCLPTWMSQQAFYVLSPHVFYGLTADILEACSPVYCQKVICDSHKMCLALGHLFMYMIRLSWSIAVFKRNIFLVQFFPLSSSLCPCFQFLIQKLSQFCCISQNFMEKDLETYLASQLEWCVYYFPPPQ